MRALVTWRAIQRGLARAGIVVSDGIGTVRWNPAGPGAAQSEKSCRHQYNRDFANLLHRPEYVACLSSDMRNGKPTHYQSGEHQQDHSDHSAARTETGNQAKHPQTHGNHCALT